MGKYASAKIIINLENINPALDKFEYIDPETLAKALRLDISEKITERRNELTNRLKARDVIPQLAFDFFIDIENGKNKVKY